MNHLGVYFGLKEICIVESKGKKIINNIVLPQTNATFAGMQDNVPADVRLIALFKDAFRTYRVNTKEASFCISGQDLIIRTFEMPLIPQRELRSAVNFEAKKYIPFKLEDLIYDFQFITNNKSKSILVLFIGMKKETLDNYISIANQLQLKLNTLEYSGFSILRFLKLSGTKDSGIIASLSFDLNSDDEVNFSVFENGFPLFSRDIILAGGSASFEQTAEADLAQKHEKLKSELRVSLDYCKRMFPEKRIKNVFVVSDADSRNELEPFFQEASLPAKFVDARRALGKSLPFSSMLVKSFAASLSKTFPLKVKINLITQKLKLSKPGLKRLDLSSLLETFKLDLRVVVLGLLICLAVFVYSFMQVISIQGQIRGIMKAQPKVTSVSADDSYEALSGFDAQYKKRLQALDNLAKNQLYATYPLDAIPRALPAGVWLTGFSFSRNDAGLPELVLEGQVYLGDSGKELDALNTFLENLKGNPVFSEYFKEVNINSIDRKTLNAKSILVFTVTAKN